MTPGEFLRAVWPDEGIYCLATPFTIPNSDPPKKVYAHKTFENVTDAVSFVLGNRATKDMFFAIHTLKAHTVYDPTKVNMKTGELGADRVRYQPNMKAAKAFFFDLDVGPDAHKYDSQAEAAAELRKFCEKCLLPKPLIASSGGGLHVYWLVVDALESSEWRNHAQKLKQLARHYGLKVDQMRTTDTASVLRVAGTFNFKDRANPREVKALTAAAETGTGMFIKMLDEAMIKAGVEAKPLPLLGGAQFEDLGLGNNTQRDYDGPPVSLKALLLSCAQMRRLALAAQAKQPITEPEWYHAVIGVGRFLEDGHRRILQFGDPSWHATIKEKIRQSEQHQRGPTSCAKIAEVSSAGDDLCVGCPFAGKVHGPIAAARYKDPAPAPVVQQLLSGPTNQQPAPLTLPDPPPPFMRLKGGGISICAKDADGNEMNTVIYEHDLFPLRRLSNTVHGTEQQVWHVELPLGNAKDFVLDADMLYDSRKFMTAIANQGIYPHKSNIPHLQEYMVAYINKLQQLVEADSQLNHLGWTDDFDAFVMPDKIIGVDGTVKVAQLSVGAQRSSAHVGKKGDAQTQADLLHFYDHPDYRAHQFFILCGLAAPIFYATGQHGVIVNVTGESGASKSTSLYTAASFWGQPELYPINGTNNGATIRARNERVAVLANLPVGVDEITHMAVHDAVDLAMSITQPGHRLRLDTTGVERAHLGSYKSTIMMTTANNSLHGLLSTSNAAGTAGSMRVVEIRFPIPHVHRKKDADDYKHNLNQHYGHLGELFVAHVVANRDAVANRVREVMAEVDTDLKIEASERFWSSTIAGVLVACEIANQLGIVCWVPAELKQWAYEKQVPQMRGIVREEYKEPLGILSDFLEQISGQTLVADQSTGAGFTGVYMVRKPQGALLAHYDKHDQMLYVLKTGFKDYCARIGANAIKILDDLHATDEGGKVIPNKHTRRTLGAGTEYAKGQSYVFSVNMAHKRVSGVRDDLEVLTGGGQQGAPRDGPSLSVVK